MKIFEISNAINYSGGVAQVIFLSESLSKKNGYDITVICQKNSEIAKRTNAKKIVLDMNSQIAASLKLAKIISAEKPDIVHCHHPKAHNIILLASFFTRIPNIIATRRVSFPIPKNPVSLFKYRTKKNSKLFAVSEKIKALLIEAGVEPSKISVIYSGTDCNVFNPTISGEKIRNEFSISKNAIVIGKIANYSYWKGYNYFLDACKTITKKIDNIYFLIVGEQTDCDELKREVENRKLEKQTKIAGFRNDIPDVISAMDISVNSSIEGEGISGVIRESLSMEKPVVATDIGGNAEIIKNYETGILIEPKNPQAIVDAVIHIIKNPDAAKKMGVAGRETVIKNFSVETMISKHEKFYAELLK